MKSTFLFSIMMFLSFINIPYTERILPQADDKDKMFSTKYVYYYYSYNGTWSGSRSVSERVIFVSSSGRYNCEYQSDCNQKESEMESAFINVLKRDYEVTSTGKTPEYGSSYDEVNAKKAKTTAYYERLGYKVQEI